MDLKWRDFVDQLRAHLRCAEEYSFCERDDLIFMVWGTPPDVSERFDRECERLARELSKLIQDCPQRVAKELTAVLDVLRRNGLKHKDKAVLEEAIRVLSTPNYDPFLPTTFEEAIQKRLNEVGPGAFKHFFQEVRKQERDFTARDLSLQEGRHSHSTDQRRASLEQMATFEWLIHNKGNTNRRIWSKTSTFPQQSAI